MKNYNLEINDKEIEVLFIWLHANPCNSACVGHYGSKYNDCNCPLQRTKKKLLKKLSKLKESEVNESKGNM